MGQQRNTRLKRMQFEASLEIVMHGAGGCNLEACLDRVRKTCRRFILIFSMSVLCCDLGSVRCTGLDGLFMPPIPEC